MLPSQSNAEYCEEPYANVTNGLSAPSGSASQVILYSKATVLNLLRVPSDVSSESWVVIGGIQVTHSNVLYGLQSNCNTDTSALFHVV